MLFTKVCHEANTTLYLLIHFKKQRQGLLLEAIRIYMNVLHDDPSLENLATGVIANVRRLILVNV